jgi:hypothetical protein
MRDDTTPDDRAAERAAWAVIEQASARRNADVVRSASGRGGPTDLQLTVAYGLNDSTAVRTARYGEPDAECVELEFGYTGHPTVELYASPAEWLAVGRRILDAFDAVGLDLRTGVDSKARTVAEVA